MSLINKGGPSPHIAVRLLETAIAADDAAIGAALDEAEEHADDVLDCLMLLVAGAVETFAILTKKS